MSYMVMECHPGYAVLLNEDGRFLKAANLRYEVGQTIYDPVLMREDTQKNSHKIRWITSSLAAVAACFLLVLGLNYYQNYMAPYSSIYLSINPQVQMDLNRQGTVIKLTGINDDGLALLADYDGKGKDKVTVADELIDRAIEMGYLSEGGRVSFSIDTPDDALFTEYGTELSSGVAEHLDGRITITLEILNHSGPQNPPEDLDVPDAEKQPKPEQPEKPSGNETAAPPTLKPPAATDYSPDSDGVTDYGDNDTDYRPGNDVPANDTPPGANEPEIPDNSASDYWPDDNVHDDADAEDNDVHNDTDDSADDDSDDGDDDAESDNDSDDDDD